MTDWLEQAMRLACTPADFYSGCRKIIRGRTLTFSVPRNLTIRDSGFTKSKLGMLRRNYLNQESLDVAQELWIKRVQQDKYGSVGFTCYNHFKKGNISGASPRGSVMGPCIQSVVLTLLPKRRVSIDIFYRTTEFFKKFPADLVFIRDELLIPFGLENREDKDISYIWHFANITMHPMYFSAIVPLLDDPIMELDILRQKDEFFWQWCVKWTARYLCKEHSRGIQKFAQALRTAKDAQERIPRSVQKKLIPYLRKHHPGFRNDYEEEDEE